MEKDTTEKNRISYSQYKKWFLCPYSFYLDRVKGLRQFEDSIHTCFGTAIHSALQLYIRVLYTKGTIKADLINLNKYFEKKFGIELKNKKIEYKEEEKDEFLSHGLKIISAFQNVSTRLKNFPKAKYEFVGVEIPIEIPVKNNLTFIGYIDLVLKDKSNGNIKIYDFKTSTSGWNKYMQVDLSRIYQLLLYKAFYSKKFNVPLNKIDVEFFILKRKLYENVNFPQSHIQKFVPPNKNKDVVEAMADLGKFIHTCFNSDGSYKDDEKLYPKWPGGIKKKNCAYCPHKNVRCDAKETPVDDENDGGIKN